MKLNFRLPICWLFFLTFVVESRAETWTLLTPVGGPPPSRAYALSAYNPLHNRMVVFGGGLNYQIPVPSLANDVWVLTNADTTTGTPGWQQLSPVGSIPAARAYASAVYDTNNNRMIIFGGNPSVGNCYVDMNDVWVLTNADGFSGTSGWVQLSPVGTAPSGRAHNTMVYDQSNNRVIIYGGNQECSSSVGDTFVLTNANGLGGTPGWTQLSPTNTAPLAHSSGVAGYDSANNLMMMFGGTSASATNDVWLLSHPNGLGGTPSWTQAAPTGNTPPRSGEVSAYDAGRNLLIVFGGSTYSETNDVWQLSRANNLGGTPAWSLITPTGTPPSPREGSSGCYNASTRQMVIFGGLTGSVTKNDLWLLNLNPSPTIFSFSPTNGIGGTSVVISGTNFTGATAVYFNGTSASFTVNSSNQITATFPNNTATGPITIVTPNGTGVSTNNFYNINQPVVTGFSPSTGIYNSTVTLTGSNFLATTAVSFNGVSAAFTVNSSTQITVTVPMCAGTGPISVIAPMGTGLSSGVFTFQTRAATSATVSSPVESVFDAALCSSSNVLFGFDGTLVVTGTKTITADTVIDGTGHNVVISGGNSVGIFSISSGRLTLKNLTIANGYATPAGGGVLNNGGNLTVINCTFTNNTAFGSSGNVGTGGAICNRSFLGGATVIGCTFVNNSAIGSTGTNGTQGVGQYGAGGTGGVGGNSFGGAIYNDNSSFAVVTNSTFFNNKVVGGTGGTGGRGYDGYMAYYYGYYYVYGGPGGLGGAGGYGFGGSIYNYNGSVLLVNATVAGGKAIAGSGGAGGYPGNIGSGSYGPGPSGGYAGGNLGFGTGQLVLKNTIVANAIASGNYTGGAISDAGNNLSSDATLILTNSTSFTNVNPLLGPLTTNGGSTMTMALLPGSPAINTGDNSAAPAADQRGLLRTACGVTDIGAFEIQSGWQIVLTGASPFTTGAYTSFTDPGAIAFNPCIGSTNLTASGTVNANSPGTYNLTYTFTDGLGNTNIATRTVLVGITNSIVYVNKSYNGGSSDGSLSKPYTNVATGYQAAQTNNAIMIFAGNYNETNLMNKPLLILATNGTVNIGKP